MKNLWPSHLSKTYWNLYLGIPSEKGQVFSVSTNPHQETNESLFYRFENRCRSAWSRYSHNKLNYSENISLKKQRGRGLVERNTSFASSFTRKYGQQFPTKPAWSWRNCSFARKMNFFLVESGHLVPECGSAGWRMSNFSVVAALFYRLRCEMGTNLRTGTALQNHFNLQIHWGERQNRNDSTLLYVWLSTLSAFSDPSPTKGNFKEEGNRRRCTCYWRSKAVYSDLVLDLFSIKEAI